jgi:hypothetical protein
MFNDVKKDLLGYPIRLISLLLIIFGFGVAARAQAPAGLGIDSLTRWPPYVYDTETFNRGRIVTSLVGSFSHTGGSLRDQSLYADIEMGITNRFLLAVSTSATASNLAPSKIDSVFVHARYRFLDESKKRPALALIANVERTTFLASTPYTPYEGQFALTAEKLLCRSTTLYGQAGYTTRNQPFEGIGLRRSIHGRLVLSGNYSYRHGSLFQHNQPVEILPPTSSALYFVAYYSATDRLGLTASFGRTFPTHALSGGFTRFASIGFGFSLRKGSQK